MRGSDSVAAMPTGMSGAAEQRLRKAGALFEAPQNPAALSAGMGLNWPHARGVHRANSGDSFSWVNHKDHVELLCMGMGSNLKGTFARLCGFEEALRKALEESGYHFARSDRLGFHAPWPHECGTNLRVDVLVRLPSLGTLPDFAELCKGLGLWVRSAGQPQGGGEVWVISNRDRLGASEIDQVDAVALGVRRLIDLQNALDRGEPVDVTQFAAVGGGEGDVGGGADVAAPEKPNFQVGQEVEAFSAEDEEWYPARVQSDAGGTITVVWDDPEGGPDEAVLVRSSVRHPVQASPPCVPPTAPPTIGFSDVPGLGLEALPGFPTERCPDKMPDLSGHFSLAAQVLRNNPSVYERLSGCATKSGVTFAQCIKPAMDNKGHPMIMTVGLFAGDEESYVAFEDIFGPVIAARHGGYGPERVHPIDPNLDSACQDACSIDPSREHMLGASVKFSRNLRGIRMPAACDAQERALVERTVVQATQRLAGSYHPLAQSSSHPGDMGSETQAQLDAVGLLFREPDARLLLSSGLGREWPHGRGVFASDDLGLAIWVNEEDHMKFVALAEGDGLSAAFARAREAETSVCEEVGKLGYVFMRSEHLGFVTCDPSNLGTGLIASVRLKIPLVAATKGFKQACKVLGLAPRTCSDSSGEAWELSNVVVLGVSEVEILQRISDGCRKLVSLERTLAGGGMVELPAAVE